MTTYKDAVESPSFTLQSAHCKYENESAVSECEIIRPPRNIESSVRFADDAQTAQKNPTAFPSFV